jgi:hypothetical protein
VDVPHAVSSVADASSSARICECCCRLGITRVPIDPDEADL